MIFKLSFIENKELLFFLYIIIIIIMILLTIYFVFKELNDTKWFTIYNAYMFNMYYNNRNNYRLSLRNKR